MTIITYSCIEAKGKQNVETLYDAGRIMHDISKSFDCDVVFQMGGKEITSQSIMEVVKEYNREPWQIKITEIINLIGGE